MKNLINKILDIVRPKFVIKEKIIYNGKEIDPLSKEGQKIFSRFKEFEDDFLKEMDSVEILRTFRSKK